MKSLLLFTTILPFNGCGKEYHTTLKESNTIMEAKIQDDLDALYFFNNGEAIKVNQDQHDRVSITMLDYLTSVNPQNNTLGEHPKTNINDKYLSLENKLYYLVNVNYNNGDLERDNNGSNITGQKRTDFEYHFKDNKLYLTIKIYESVKFSNVNSVIAERTFVGVK